MFFCLQNIVFHLNQILLCILHKYCYEGNRLVILLGWADECIKSKVALIHIPSTIPYRLLLSNFHFSQPNERIPL